MHDETNLDQLRFTLTYEEVCKAARRHTRDGNSEVRDVIMTCVRDLRRVARKLKLELPDEINVR
jgi:hypothetical protein